MDESVTTSPAPPVSPKAGPKDVALWLGAMIALYGSVISLLALLYGYVDHFFPDPALEYGYYDPYGGAVRGAMAFLIVGVPAYLVLTGLLNRELREHPEKEDLWVRRWIVVATLFIAALTILIRLVGLVNDFLGGELQTRSLLKFLATVIVLGGGITYYWEELRGRWRTQRARPIGIAVLTVVVLTIVGGFLVIGSPATQRDFRLDEQRVASLQELQWRIVDRYQTTGELPATQEVLSDDIGEFKLPTDPVTGERYTYNVTGNLSFELCATFARETPAGRGGESPAVSGFDSWFHPAGEYCFDRTIDPTLYPVNPKA